MKARRPSRSDPLQEPAKRVIHGHAARLVQETDAAVARLRDPTDVHALHDTRVALRRLRGWLKAFRSELPLKPRRRRALRRLARASNRARDAEVSLEWLAVLERRLDPRAQPGMARFMAELKAIRDVDYRALRARMPVAWIRQSRKLMRAVSPGAYRDKERVFLAAFLASLRGYAADFESALDRARLAPTPAHLHALRIAGKRQRYLVETLLPWYPQASTLVRELKGLHDIAGAIQDLQRLLALSEHAFLRQVGSRYRRLLAAYTDAGADHRTLKRPDLTPQLSPLLWICRAAAAAQQDFIRDFRKRYLGRRLPACVKESRKLMAALGRLVTAP